MNDRRVAEIVERVVERLRGQGLEARGPRPVRLTNPDAPPLQRIRCQPPASVPAAKNAPAISSAQPDGEGLYGDVDRACRAAAQAYEEYARLGFQIRFKIVEALRKAALEHLEAWSRAAVAETGMGRVEDKILKNRLVTTRTPGPEILQLPESFSGDDGHTITERAAFGVIASIIPCTNSTETVINNGISMLSAGNAVVFNPHPIARQISAEAVRVLNRAIRAAGGPGELLCCLREPSIETANALMRHPIPRLVMVTGGGAVVEAAMSCGKRAICAGPGNPPAVVDETADLDRAGRDLVLGASLDNNVVCTDEKVVVAVDSIAGRLKEVMLRSGAVEVSGPDVERLTSLVLAEAGGPRTGKHGAPNRKLVGRNASVILRELGVNVADEVRLALVEVEPDHPLAWTEQLLPVLPLVRMKDADAAIAHGVALEGNRRHTASIHSRRVDRITAYARAINCSICVANAPNYSGLGQGGEGYTSFSIATPTGEGLTTARTFSRERRLALCAGALKFA